MRIKRSFLALILGLAIMSACGDQKKNAQLKEEARQQMEQQLAEEAEAKRQDSLKAAKVKTDSIKAEERRLDSIQQVKEHGHAH